MSEDWHFKSNDTICSFRAVGVLIDNNSVLVQRDGEEYALPGGHVKVGETAEETLVREFMEETGLTISCKRMIWCDESFFSWNGSKAHGIAFYYLIETKDDIIYSDFTSQKDNCNIKLEWVLLDKVKELNIYPYFIKEKITDISNGIEHFIHRD